MNDIIVLENKSIEVVTQAKGIAIINNDTYKSASEFIKAIKGLQKEIKDTFQPIIEKANIAHKEAINQRDKHLDPLLKAEWMIKNKMIEYSTEQEKIRIVEQRKLEELQKKEAEKLLKKAEKAEAKGNIEKAEELFEQAEITQSITPLVETKVEKVEGISYKETWYAEVYDLMGLCKGVVDNIIPISCILPNMPALNQLARTYRLTNKIAGVNFKCEKVVAVRN